jgi:hypothetical protein
MSSPSPKAQPSNFSWYEYHTADSDKAAAFYGAVLGWGTRDSGMPDGSYTLLTVGQTMVGGIMKKPADSFAKGAKPGWLGYIAVEDVDRFVKLVEESGGAVHRAAEDIPGAGRFAVVADAQGANFVLFQRAAGIEPPAPLPPATPGTAAWHEIAAVDGPSEFAFYSRIFGWSKASEMDMGPGGVYQIFAAGAEPIGGMMTRKDPAQTPAWLFYFNVSDIDAAIARVKEHGGSVVNGPMVVPGGQRVSVCLDPQGAPFGMVGPS